MVRAESRPRGDASRGAGERLADPAPLGRALRAVADLVLPLACAACGGSVEAGATGIVCSRCWTRLELLPAPRCERCGHPTGGRPCRWCAQLPPFLRAGRSVCWATTGSGRRIVHALKYGGWHAVAEGIAERMARLDWPEDVLMERAALVPVPLAASRARERGYNQSERLARALARRWRLAVWDDVVARTRETRTQTRLTPEERASNVHGAFQVTARNVLRGTHVVLVDDVVTTGATLTSSARALLAAGARSVGAITVARER